jgi:uncharacterized protein
MTKKIFMEIFIHDIPEEGLSMSFDTSKDAWFRRLIENALGESFNKDGRATLDLTLLRFDEDIDLDGELYVLSHPTCDRCLKRYREEQRLPLHVHMTPLYESRRQMERENDDAEVELVKEDVEFSYYEGDRVHLDEILSEQVILVQPMKHLCDENCKGLCQRCGKDLNEGPCDCREEHSDPRWDALKNIKPVR